MSAFGDLEGCHQKEGKVGQELSHGHVDLNKGTHGAEITFSSTNVDNKFIATLAKGVHLRALNLDPEAA